MTIYIPANKQMVLRISRRRLRTRATRRLIDLLLAHGVTLRIAR